MPEDEQLFDPKQYLQEYFPDVDEEFDNLYRFWCRAVRHMPEGGRALELGIGPSLYTAIPLAARVDEIHAADLLDSNLAEIDAWLKKKPGHFDWKNHIERVLEFEGLKPDAKDIGTREDQLRSKIKRLRHCDLRREFPLGEKDAFDLVTAHYCTEAAAGNNLEWGQIINRIVALVRPGGAFLLSVAGGLSISRIYDSQETRIPPPDITTDAVRTALSQAGMKIRFWDTIPAMDGDPYSDTILSYSVKPPEELSQETLREFNFGIPALGEASGHGGIVNAPSDDSEEGLLRQLASYPKLELIKGAGGSCVITRTPVHAGEVVFDMSGECVCAPSRYSLQIEENRHIRSSIREVDDFVDHSCDPNCRIHISSDVVTLVATREIAVGEKLTFNYLTTEWDMAEPFECECGSSNCFKHIAGFRYLSLNQRVSIEPLLTPFLRRKHGETITDERPLIHLE